MWTVDRPPQWVGREQELAVLHTGVAALGRGEGAVVWVEGEPGIGKSSLVAEAIASGSGPDWDIGWGIAGKLTERLPLQVVLDCLKIRPDSPDPRRAKAADLIRDLRPRRFMEGDTWATGIEVLLALVDELCAADPVVLVLDDLQWADDASLIVWYQLAASIDQLRLLLVGISRPTPRRAEVQELRPAVIRGGGAVVTLGPLAETDVTALVTAMLGSPPGDALRQLTAQAAGNPLYVRELIEALVREQALEIGSAAEVSTAREHLPASLAAVLDGRLSFVSAETAQMLRVAALLGGQFAVTDLAVVLRSPVSELMAGVQEAMAAGILIGSGQELAFRHLLIQQALYESMPTALRKALHIEAARELAVTGMDALSVAQQLSAANLPGGEWVRKWLIDSGPALAALAPQLAAELLRRELSVTPVRDEARDGLTASLVWALLAVGSYEEAAKRASWALTTMTDPEQRAKTYWALTRAQVSHGQNDDAIKTIREALASANLPGKWRARMLALLAMLERAATGDLEVADALAVQALTAAEDVGDPRATAHALTDLWLTASVRRDHAAALTYIDRALYVLGDDPGRADLGSFAVDARVFTLQNLDRWPQAELALRQGRELAQRRGNPDRATWVTAAVLRYWLGQWDDALAEMGSDDDDVPGLTHSFLRERWSALLVHGVSALIAVRRDERTTAGQHLHQGLVLPIQTISDRENQDFLVAAHALALEQGGETQQAMLTLAVMLPRRGGEMTLIHQWLPDLVRMALAADDRQTAQAAVQACKAEAEAEVWPARATAASLRCRGLFESDAGQLQEAVTHYREVGPTVLLPAVLEDLAVVQAESGRDEEARAALNEAVSLYEVLQAQWDIRRAEGRLRRYGIRRGVRGRRRQSASGWEALTLTEVKIAALMARGDSTSDIAGSMFLSRRTVQTYISRILAKLGARSRVDIVREALRQSASP